MPTPAPKCLDKKQQTALLRELEREVNAARTTTARWQSVRDKALVTLLLQTGLRVREACNLHLDDVAITDRKGSLGVREGKGLKARSVYDSDLYDTQRYRFGDGGGGSGRRFSIGLN